jgi:hypothetical protein
VSYLLDKSYQNKTPFYSPFSLYIILFLLEINNKIPQHIIEEIMINEMFMIGSLIFTKNIGAVPKNNPMVVNPNATPGDFLSTDTNIPSVIAIVILKNITPIRDTIINSSPKHKNGIAKSVLIKDIFLTPNISDKMPPKALPIPIVKKKIIF